MKAIPYYLFFFALAYTLTKFLPFQDLLLLLILLNVVEGLIFACFYYFVRDTRRAGFLTFLFLVWGLYFGSAAHIVQSLLHLEYNLVFLILFLIPWTLTFWLIKINWLWCKAYFPSTVTSYLNIVTIAIVLFASYRLLFGLNYRYFDTVIAQDVVPDLVRSTDAYPDIYYIILDGHGREDTLQEYLEFDDSQFIDFLESRGFNVAEQSQANYLHTLQSISSSLNMGYINPTNQLFHLTAFKERVISENQVSSLLNALGYQFITFYNPYELIDITSSDLYFPLYDHSRIRTMRMATLLSPGSLAAIFLEAELVSPLGTYGDYQEYLLSSMEQLAQIPFLPGLKFVFFHILIPHTPFIFDQDGPITPDRPYLLDRDFRGPKDAWISGYTGQARFIDNQLEKTIDAILENSTTPPIIIIQGDHGPGVYFSRSCLEERASILNAYYLPGLTNDPIYETITPVNTFRVIFNQYFGAQLDLLEDKVYFLENVESAKCFDVTQESQRDCVLP